MTSNMIAPSVRLNSYHVPASYGPNVYPVPPGRTTSVTPPASRR
ncbi:MAG: hypothetical protein JWN91_1855 [Nocardioides sp.]|nr:hypothetical protein [Nocardioides sp.]